LTPFISIHSGFEFGRLIPLPNTSDVPDITVLLENSGVTVELSLGYFLTRHLEFQGNVTYGRAKIMNDVGVGIGGFPLGKEKVSDANIYSYSGNILYHIPLSQSSIFFTAGLGGMTLDPEVFNSKTRLMLNFGAGIKIKISDQIFPVVEVKDYISFFNYGEDFDMAYIAIYSSEFKKSQHHVGLRVGVSYLF
jgi:hypothetical protein